MTDTTLAINKTNSLVNQGDAIGLPQRVAQAIKDAAAKTGVDFSYLLHKAAQESGFDPNAKASTSTATGLYQFTNQTWLRTLKEHGDQYGLGQYTGQIKMDASGVARVTNPDMRKAILNLRKDPEISAEMAGELDKDNLDSLKANVGGRIGATDLYLAHFLGAGGASDFLKAMKANPNTQAANVLPDAAASNPSVFYTPDGAARSLKQIYQHFAQKFDGNATMVASAAPVSSQASKAIYAPSYTMASADTSIKSSVTNYVAPVMSSIKSQNSSLFATMVLAQAGLSDASTSMTSTAVSDINGHEKKSAIDILGSIA